MTPPTSGPLTGCATAGVELARYLVALVATAPLVTGRGEGGPMGGPMGVGVGVPLPYHGGLPCDPLTLEVEGEARPPHTTYQYPTSTNERGVPCGCVIGGLAALSWLVVLGVAWIVWRIVRG